MALTTKSHAHQPTPKIETHSHHPAKNQQYQCATGLIPPHHITVHACSVTRDESYPKKMAAAEQRYIAKVKQVIEAKGITYF